MEEEYRGYKISIERDVFASDPRKEFDHFGHMVCWHKRYNLGDEQPRTTPAEWLFIKVRPNVGANGRLYDKMSDAAERDDTAALMGYFERDHLVLPVYMYEHGGIALSTGRGYPFNDLWDAGQVGFIYASKTEARKEFGRLTKGNIEKVYNLLKAEVEEYSYYLNGDMYFVEIMDHNGEVIDSCSGFYGFSYALQEAKEMVDSYVKQDEAEKWEKVTSEPVYG